MSASGMVMTWSIASTTLSQLRPITAPISLQRLRPLRPLKLSTPLPSEPSRGLPLKNLVTVGSSQTDPTDDTMANVRCRVATESSVGFSAKSSCTPIRSYWRSSGGSNRCALASVKPSHAGWSVRSFSVLVLTKAVRSATDSKP